MWVVCARPRGYTWRMPDDTFVTLGQASALTGCSKRKLRALLLSRPASGSPPRRAVARSSLRLGRLQHSKHSAANAIPGKQPDQSAAVPIAPVAPSDILMILEMLREKDQQIARLQEDRVRLSGQVGYLQAQVSERDTRLRLLEAAAIEGVLPRLLPEAADTPPPSTNENSPGDRQCPRRPHEFNRTLRDGRIS